MNDKKAIERIKEMEEILDRASKIMKDLESNIAEFESLQSEIKELEKYYTGKKWKSDLSLMKMASCHKILSAAFFQKMVFAVCLNGIRNLRKSLSE